MDNIIKDPRFSHITKDAKFKKIPRKEQKVKIDKRFQSMFTDKRFQLKSVVDKRGRPLLSKGSEHLERYYDLSDSNSEESSDDDLSGSENENKALPAEIVDKSNKASRNILPPEIKAKIKDLAIDYARGEGLIVSDSSSEEESSSASDDEDIQHDWGELDKDAGTIDEETARIAICNLDWDRITSQDLMVLFHSFLPPGGVLHSVTIYPSEFGLKRIEEEERQGPSELASLQAADDQEDETLNNEQREILRQYQLKRLRYFYAVLVFDSPKTANHVYNECDGLEYESSMNRLDLRFVPNDTTFDQQAREVCTTLPDPTTYKPRLFRTTALTQVKVDLTWDETDPARQELISAAHNGKLDVNKLDRFLAASSSEEEDDVVHEKINLDAENEPTSEKGAILKYKALLADLEKSEDTAKDEPTMEITWDLKLEQKAAEKVKEATKLQEKKTPFEQFLEKRKEKKKNKREGKKAKNAGETKDDDDDDEEEQAFSDDDIPSDIDMDDPYFQSEINGQKKTKKKGQVKNKKGDEESDEAKQKQAELELLMMEENNEGTKKHFNLNSITKNELQSKNKKKNKKRKAKEIKHTDGDFTIDVKDDRFSAIYTSHHYNVDPADPQYRPTEAMKALITEKIRRRTSNEPEEKMIKLEERKNDSELNMLVKSVKRKTLAIKDKKNGNK